jgi:hypothetical protein
VYENQPSLALLKTDREQMDAGSSLLAGFLEGWSIGDKELRDAPLFNIM